MVTQLTPNVGRVLIEVEKEDTKTSGGLFIPASVDMGGIKKGRVHAVGTPRKVNGDVTSLELLVNDRVLVDPLGGVKVKVDGTEFILMRMEDVLAKVN